MGEVTVVDTDGSKKVVEGLLQGFVVKLAKKTSLKHIVISGLDDTWANKRVLCILIDNGATFKQVLKESS